MTLAIQPQHVHNVDPPDPPNRPLGVWDTSGIVERLKQLWGNNTSTRIAKILSQEFNVTLSRAAVTGKLDRLGLLCKGAPRRNPDEQKARKRERDDQHNMSRRAERANRLGLRVVPSAPSVAIAPNDIASLNLTFDDLTDQDCHWPHGDNPPYLFCGQPAIEGRPYCKFHCAIGYRPVEQRRRA